MLAYCTNVHPSEEIDDLMRVISRDAREVREALELPRLPVGLYLSNQSSLVLRKDRAALEELQAGLAHSKLDCITINGFPFGGFHDAVVKERVYRPDWADNARIEYSIRMAEVFVHLLPEGAKGCISSVAGGFKSDFETRERVEAMTRALSRLAYRLYQIEEETGRRIVVALEPEPFTFLERDAQTFDYFRETLWRYGREFFVSQFGVRPDRAEELIRRYIGVCYDACHQAVFFEDAARFFERARSEELTIGKIQLSSALEIRDHDALRELEAFAEDRYLHQTVVLSDQGQVAFLDLPEAIDELRKMKRFEMARTHFHVPLFWDADAPLGSTQKALRQTLRAAHEYGITDCLEIETYTWSVLPQEFQEQGVGAGIAEEFRWVQKELEALSAKDSL